MKAAGGNGDRILWVDDEVDLLRPHLMLLEEEGYEVEAIMNGHDALELLATDSFDLVLLDEQMPGLRGIEVLSRLRDRSPRMPVVMVTKSEADSTMHEAIGRRADDYIVKPTSPRQVLSVVTRLLEGPALRHERIARDFTQRFGQLRSEMGGASAWDDWAELYSEIVDWELRFEESDEHDLEDTLRSLKADLRREYGAFVEREYVDWVHEGGAEGPLLSVDVIPQFFRPLLSSEEPCMLVVVDCMRLDQWRAIMPLVSELFEVEEALYSSILPTATPFSRNAIFSALFPDELADVRPDWWELKKEGSYNELENQLFDALVGEITGYELPTHYEKIFTADEGRAMLQRLSGYLSRPSATALVFGFVDLLTHGRSESNVLREMARDDAALRSLTVNWFRRSSAFEALERAAERGVRVLFTTDHGSIHCQRSVVVYAKRDATDNLRYKFGEDLRVEDPRAVLSTSDPGDLRLPPGDLRTNYVLCKDDYFLVYPTKLREYQKRYRDTFLHGGASPEEMILPAALLTPR